MREEEGFAMFGGDHLKGKTEENPEGEKSEGKM